MDNILSLNSFFLATVFVVPGYIILYFRSHFIYTTVSVSRDHFASAVTLSALNFAAFGWVAYFVVELNTAFISKIIAWIFISLVSPTLIGFIAAYGSQKHILRRLYSKIGLAPIHVIPTSWDYKFSTARESWVLVELKDGTHFAGIWGSNSFASSNLSERDLLIETVYEVPANGPWVATNKSVLICSGEIRTIEFSPLQRSNDV